MAPPKLLLLAVALLTCAGCAFPAKHCPNCGTTAVPYPLSTDTTCGDQSYKIRCDSGSQLVFDSLNNSYPITSVSPSSQRFVIQPASLLSNVCVTSDMVHQGIQLNDSLPFNVTSSNTIIYLNCTDSILRSPLNCSSSSLCHTYLNRSDDAPACDASPICCTFRAGGSSTSYMIRVRESGCSAYTSFVNLDPNLPVDRWPESGVEIQWVSPREPLCGTQSDCDEDGGGGKSTCGPDPVVNGVRRCFCNAGLVWDPIGGSCVENVTCQDPGGCDSSNKTALIAGLVSGLGTLLIRMVAEERLMDVIDPMLKEGASNLELDTMKALGFLAVGCLEERRQNRPSMKEVTEEIEYIMSIATSKVVEN
ncbi:hypothetical protein FEM48_Zijuj03G0060800 [Ziziphus jujuba var. spinosa]|uniref:Wall-associated receptor kinase galacturonan-binding domain-containing protein n=1 Tax=Ziziphus jujuba var. spinosa TaxID=714518 RepID=A0A978VNL9_ZIZJJ|nr:hypothetical protein FEM48_Zijuj03G0060800 [Ziziphus jujuba var. spinosa]